MICKCKSKAFYLHIIYKHDIPLKLTIAKGIVLREATLSWGLISYLYGVICLYCYRLIYLYRYCVIYLLLYCMLAAWGGITFFISIFYFCSLLRPLFFMIVVAVSLSFGFLPCKGMAVLSDTKHQAMPYSAKTFPESLPQMLHIWVFQKTFYRIAWCSDFIEPPSSNARKKAI